MKMLSSWMASVAMLAMVTLSFFARTVDATALTYNIGAHEKACFYTWADVPSKKIAFYFSVSPYSSVFEQ